MLLFNAPIVKIIIKSIFLNFYLNKKLKNKSIKIKAQKITN